MMFKSLLVLSSLGVLVSCGADYKNERKKEDYSYDYSLNGCATGKQSYDSKQSYCEGLLNEKRNNSCATDTRHKTYENQCEEFGSLEIALQKNS